MRDSAKRRLFRSTITDKSQPPAGTRTDNNSYTNKYKNLSKFKTKKNNDNCNCWVCKILDSSVTKEAVEADTLQQYEGYNIVSETRDSIYYDLFLPINIFDNNEYKLNGGQMYIAEDKIRGIVQDELAKKHFNGVTLNKNEY